MNLTSKQKGNLTELQCLTAFYEAGCHVSIPYGENSRYDFIVDADGQLLKVQVKTSSPINENVDAISFSCRSTTYNSTGSKSVKYTSAEIDYFATYWEGKCYLIPVNECSNEKTLRFKVPSNGQVKGISFAADYELKLQLDKLKGGSS